MRYITQLVSEGLVGEIRLPGDKSISHRCVLFSALAEGTSQISGLLEGEDVLATLAAFQSMGVQVQGPNEGELLVYGVGLHGLSAPKADLDMGNSGTAMRLLSGVLSAQAFSSRLVGDASLSARPMRRVCTPLHLMGADCQSQENGCPPLEIHPVAKLNGIEYTMPIASAQVKSAILLAAMYADGKTTVIEPAITRNHTENMLHAYGYACETQKLTSVQSQINLQGCGRLRATNIDVPADISSAAFFMVAASIVPGSDIVLRHVGMNPTRTGVIHILNAMGASIEILHEKDIGGESVADIRVQFRGLNAIEIDEKWVSLAIDEFPVLCIAAACAKGVTKIRDAQELRHKESDRIATMAEGLRKIGVTVSEFPDGMDIQGGDIHGGGNIETCHDHRIAMSFAIAGAVSKNAITIQGCETVATSFPNFTELAEQVGISISIERE